MIVDLMYKPKREMKNSCVNVTDMIKAILLPGILFFFFAKSTTAADPSADPSADPAAGHADKVRPHAHNREMVMATVVIENNGFKYEIGADGRNQHFIDKASGVDYLNAASKSYCAYVTKEGKDYPVSSVSLKGNQLKLVFTDAGVSATILVTKGKDWIDWKVTALNGPAESLTFINAPLTLKGLPDEPFAACVLSMNIFTHVKEMPALQSNLWATAYKRFGIKGAQITLLGVPQKNILPAIREVMTNAKDIPHSNVGGAWALQSKEGYGSYLMDFGSLTESTVDEWITKCKSVGFNQIDHHGGTPEFFSFGSFDLNKKKWPEGWTNFKRINQRLHEAGISSIFHTYAFFIDKEARYVTPVPSPDLDYFNAFTLTAPIGKDDSVIEVKESTRKVTAITGFHFPNSRTLRIGEELIEYSGTTKTPPYRFTGCKRAANGTKASAHQASAKAFHLKEMFGRFLPGSETALFKEIANRTAEIVDECNFDGIYFDAIDGNDIIGGVENFWYYGSKFIFAVAEHLKRPVGMEMSSMVHNWWHFRSRWQAWDVPRRGFKRFVDIHSASLKSKEVEHGYWRGDTSQINILAPLENGGLLLPLQLGWWLNFTWDPPQTETTFTDDIEYLGCKMIGNNAGLAMIGGIEKKDLDENPSFRRLNAIIRQYEELRHKNYFSDNIRKLLRQPGKEFTLFKEGDSSWNFKPTAYQRHKVAGMDHPSAHWTVNNAFDAQPVKLRIEPLMCTKSYDDPETEVLTDFSGTPFRQEGVAKGVSGGLIPSTEKDPGGEPAGIFSASSSGLSPQNGSWISMEKKFGPWLDLGKKQALGVWIKGDGNGELLNLRLETPQEYSAGVRGDHYIKIDFTGWKYFELVEIESAAFTDYSWPGAEISSDAVVKDLFLYKSYLHTVHFDHVDKLKLWYNNLPAGKEVKCIVGAVKALPIVPVRIKNPSVMIKNEKIVFPVEMESGMYLEFLSASNCKLYGPKGEFLKDVTPIGKAPDLVNGENEVSFTCEGPKGINARAQITIIGEGKPLRKE